MRVLRLSKKICLFIYIVYKRVKSKDNSLSTATENQDRQVALYLDNFIQARTQWSFEHPTDFLGGD